MTQQAGDDDLGVVADIGGTNCRFAIASRRGTALIAPASTPRANHADFTAALGAYLQTRPERGRLRWAVIAVAGPVGADGVSLTNGDWRIAGGEIADAFALARVELVNDFTAMAASITRMDTQSLLAIGGGAPQAAAGAITMAVIGPGTGLGVGGLVRGPEATYPLSTEGGHVLFAPIGALEREINRVLEGWFERVSYERLLSGEGLENIYRALCEIEGAPAADYAARDISRLAAGGDAQCVRTLGVFTQVLGAFAGDVALVMGARGGVYIAGGMITKLLDQFDQAAFRARFEAKGRFRAYMEAIPARIIVHPYPGLLGAAALAPGAG